MSNDTIEYGAESDFHAAVMRIDDAGHGFDGVVYEATTRQATDFDSGDPKWFRNRKVVATSSPQPGDDPVKEYVFHIAVKKGRGAFTKRDDNGDAVKLSSGKNALEVRDLVEEDIAVVFGSAWMSRAAKSVRLNKGHHVVFKRLTVARDESGDRMRDIQWEIDIKGTVDDPKPYKAAVTVGGADYDDSSPF